MGLRSVGVGLLLAAIGAGAAMAGPKVDPTAVLEASRAVVGTSTLADLQFTDTEGGRTSLGAYRGRPLLLSLVYTACADVCPTLIQNLYPAVVSAREALGPESFAVATIGFDARHDTPDRLRSFARQQGVDLANWRFLASDQKTIDRLAEIIGFSFYPSAGGFDHLAQVTVLDGEGRIYQQVYGGVFEAPQIVEPLKDLVFGRERSILSIAGIVDRVKFFCTVYDPRSGRYYFNYSLFIGIAIGVVSLGGVALVLVREWRRSIRHERLGPG